MMAWKDVVFDLCLFDLGVMSLVLQMLFLWAGDRAIVVARGLVLCVFFLERERKQRKRSLAIILSVLVLLSYMYVVKSL